MSLKWPNPALLTHAASHAWPNAGSPAPQLITDGLVIYLDGTDTSTMTLAGSRVDAWNSKLPLANFATGVLGTGFNPTYSAGAFGGAGGVVFGGNNVYLGSTSSLSQINNATGLTILAIQKFTSVSNLRQAYYATGDGNGVNYFGVGTQFRAGLGTGIVSPYGLPVNTPFIHGIVVVPGNYRPILDGTIASGASGVVPTSGTWGTMQLMACFAGGSSPVQLQSYLLWNRALSDAEIATQVAWLRAQFSVPTFPAFSSSAFNIIVDGNSIAAGATSLDKWTMADGIMNATLAPTTTDWYMAAQGGLTTANNITRYPTVVAPQYNASVPASRRVYIHWEISNDISTGQNATQAYAHVKTLCQMAKATGFKVVVCTCLPRSTFNPTMEGYRVTVNTNILANALSEGWADVVADIGNDATLSNPADTTYYSDGTHLTSAGHLLASAYVTSALNSLMT